MSHNSNRRRSNRRRRKSLAAAAAASTATTTHYHHHNDISAFCNTSPLSAAAAVSACVGGGCGSISGGGSEDGSEYFDCLEMSQRVRQQNHRQRGRSTSVDPVVDAETVLDAASLTDGQEEEFYYGEGPGPPSYN